MDKGMRFTLLIYLMRPNYFIFTGYLKTRGGEGGSSEPPLDPSLACEDFIFSMAPSSYMFHPRGVGGNYLYMK